jgi:monovalent cation:H+ antiporter-2, CPA2 family
MTRQVLMHFNVPPHDVLRVASAIRHERYDQAGDKPDSGLAIMSQVGEIARQLELAWTGVSSESPLDGRTLSELRIRTTTGLSVVGIIRNGVLMANPSGELRLERGDLVAVLGTRDQIERFEQAMRAGAPLVP